MAKVPIDENNANDAPEAIADPGSGAAQQPAAGDSNELTALRAERDDLFQRLARATAEYKNSQKRMQAEFDQRIAYANSSLIKSLLPVIDNFERALVQDASRVDASTILKGMQIVHDQWLAVFKQQNVEEIAPVPGEPFDATAGHEAVMQQDAPPEFAGKGQVITQLFAKGYKLNDRVLRPAQVAVSRS